MTMHRAVPPAMTMIVEMSHASTRIALPAASIDIPGQQFEYQPAAVKGRAGSRFMNARNRLDADNSLRNPAPRNHMIGKKHNEENNRLKAGPAEQIIILSPLLHPASGTAAENPRAVTLIIPALIPHALAAIIWPSSWSVMERKAAAYSASMPANSIKTGIIAAVMIIYIFVSPMTSFT